MEIKALSDKQIAALKAPLPEAAVKQHPTKKYLSTIKAIYEVERLNEVFGIGSWKQHAEIIENQGNMIVVRLVLSIPQYCIELESFGGNDNEDRGDAYKGAVTDAFTKICSLLGIGMDVYKGLADRDDDHGGNGNGTNGRKNNNVAGGQESQLPWLNFGTPQWDGAVAKLVNGQTTLEKIKTVMKLSKDNEKKLMEAVKSAKSQN